jgi:hypothetical protein
MKLFDLFLQKQKVNISSDEGFFDFHWLDYTS